MIIIEETNISVNKFYDKLKETHNNLYLCNSQNIINNESKDSSLNSNPNLNKVFIKYDLNNQIIRNKIIKMKKIINKIEELPKNIINHRYYELYNKENKKKMKLVKIQYKKISNFFQKIKKTRVSPNLSIKISKLNQRRLNSYKKLI